MNKTNCTVKNPFSLNVCQEMSSMYQLSDFPQHKHMLNEKIKALVLLFISTIR